MNCFNHPDAAVAAYCQNCGKALCTACVRSVSGVIYCEQCLAAKLGIGAVPGYTAHGTPAGVNYTVNQGGYTVTGSSADVNYVANGIVPPPLIGPNPGLAMGLGFIPGVGAMYNGQYVKALVHVLVFVILVGITENHGIFGIFIAAWVVYQVFDAFQTAKARRDGLLLPDPFGLNELGSKLGISNSPGAPSFTQTYTTTAVPPVPPMGSAPGSVPGYPPGPVSGFAPGFTGAPQGAASGFTDPYPPYAPYTAVPPVQGYGPGGVPPYGSVPTDMDPNVPVRRREPIGAMVLIGLGLLFLFNTLGIFRFNWIGHFWPIFIIGLGAWLLIRRTRGLPPPPPPAPPAGGGQ
jgi:hypothetical protein